MTTRDPVLIAMFVPTLEVGGAERAMVTLANGFRRAGHHVDLVVAKSAGDLASELDSGIRVVGLGARRTLFALPPLIRYLRRSRPSAMLTTLADANLIAAVACALARVPIRLVVRESTTASAHYRYATGIRRKAIAMTLRLAYSAANHVVSPSRGVAEDLVSHLGVARQRVVVIPNPLDLGYMRALAARPTFDRISATHQPSLVLGIGRLSAEKDFATLIRAFAKVVEHVDARLVVLGEGEERSRLEVLVRALGLNNQVTMPGFVENPFAYLKQASVYVLSSRYEGLPNTLLQAIALDVPAVATDCPSGPREILDDGRWGRLVPIADVAQMADAITEGLAGRLRAVPQDVIEARYGMMPVTRQYLDLLFA
jgi:glycosyltransferase involved in cell wall biosynthesis